MKKRLVQIQSERGERRVAVVEEPRLRLLRTFTSVYALATEALRAGGDLSSAIEGDLDEETLDYEAVYAGKSEWSLQVPADHPEPARMLVSGTGLTHTGSARDRNAMHDVDKREITDSMKMFQWGVEGGRPADEKIGIAPEWFYKGTGGSVQAHGQALDVPTYAEDGGEEAEIAGIYIIDHAGRAWRIGMAAGNEFSDHVFEKKNYLNLAGSKLRTCSLGPELAVDAEFGSVEGSVSIERDGKIVWSKAIRSGEAEMCHSLGNIEHHHFKFASHRRPGDLHVHYFGAHSLSFGDGVRLADGDVMGIRFDGFGRALRNPVRIVRGGPTTVKVSRFK